MLAVVVTCPIVTAWMPKGRSCKPDQIVPPERGAWEQPQTAAGVIDHMEKHIAELEGDD
jgi:hypothetical protein